MSRTALTAGDLPLAPRRATSAARRPTPLDQRRARDRTRAASPFVAPDPGLAGVHTRNAADCQGASGRFDGAEDLWFHKRPPDLISGLLAPSKRAIPPLG